MPRHQRVAAAVGILMVLHHLTAAQATDLLTRASHHTHLSIRGGGGHRAADRCDAGTSAPGNRHGVSGKGRAARFMIASITLRADRVGGRRSRCRIANINSVAEIPDG